jgi:hypothetical protein
MLILTFKEFGGFSGVDVVGCVILMFGGGDDDIVVGDELILS